TTYATGNINTAAAGSNYLYDGTDTTALSTSPTFNAILIRGSNLTIADSGTNTLNVTSGAVVASGRGNAVNAANLNFAGVEGVLQTGASGDFTTINSVIQGAVAAANVGLTKGGTGTIALGGGSANTYSGVTQVGGGVLRLQKGGALGT